MKNSRAIQRQQKTSYEGSSAKDRLETEGMYGVPSVPMAFSRETSSAGCDNLMEKILSRENMFMALKRVEKNIATYT